MSPMSPEESQLIDKYEVLFAQEGWKELVNDLSSKRHQMALSLMEARSDIDQVNYTRGLAAGYQYIVGLEEFITQYKHQQELPDAV